MDNRELRKFLTKKYNVKYLFDNKKYIFLR